MELKTITKEAVTRALEKAVRYRLLNQPTDTESICRDVLAIDPDNQDAHVNLILALTDQFAGGKQVTAKVKEAMALLDKLDDPYRQVYYHGIVNERRAKYVLNTGRPGSEHDAYDWFRDAQDDFEKAIQIRPTGNDDAVLRWNACERSIADHKLEPKGEEKQPVHYGE